MKATRSVLLALVAIASLFLGGCKSTWDFWKNDAKSVVKSNIRRLDNANRSIHLHFLNTDWTDPYND